MDAHLLLTELRSFLAENSKGGRDSGAGNVSESGALPAYHVRDGGAGSGGDLARKGPGEIGSGRADRVEDGEDPVHLTPAPALFPVSIVACPSVLRFCSARVG